MQNEFNLKIIILFYLSLVCLSCKSQGKQTNDKQLKLNETYYDNEKALIKEKYYLNSSRLRDSLYVLFSTSGDTIRKGYYKDSRKHGLWEEPNFEKLRTQGSRAYYYYHQDTLQKKVEKNWEEKSLKTLFSEITTIYKDSVYKTAKVWAEGGKFIKTFSETIYFNPNNLTQNQASIFTRHWHYNTDVLSSEDFTENARQKWYKIYSPEGKLYKEFKFNEEGVIEKLTVYNDDEKVEKIYNISKYIKKIDEKEMKVYKYYYDENDNELSRELFNYSYP